MRIGDPRFQLGDEDDGNTIKLRPALVTFRQKERLTEKLADVRNERLLLIIETLVENSKKNRELLLQLTRNNTTTTVSDTQTGSSIPVGQPITTDHDLDRNMNKLREIFEFDIDEAQLLKTMKPRTNHE